MLSREIFVRVFYIGEALDYYAGRVIVSVPTGDCLKSESNIDGLSYLDGMADNINLEWLFCKVSFFSGESGGYSNVLKRVMVGVSYSRYAGESSRLS